MTHATCLRGAIVLAALALTAPDLGAVTINVPGDELTIQAGIDAARDGDVVRVAQGTYEETFSIVDKSITLRSVDGADVTIIDVSDFFLPFSVGRISNVGPGTIVEGFTFTGGRGDGFPGDLFGGGLLIASANPTIRDCVFVENFATVGGGMFISGESTPVIVGCTFRDNGSMSLITGAAIYGGRPIVRDCLFELNTGGVTYEADGWLINCLFLNNQVDLEAVVDAGPGGATIAHCTFSGNTVEDSVITGEAWVVNSVVWGNVAPNAMGAGFTGTVGFSNIEGGYGGLGNIDADPLFVDATGGDLRLSAGSPCIDAGMSVDVDTDLDGNERAVDDPATINTGVGFPAVSDMGPYEFGATQPCTGDINGDGVLDVVDLLILMGAWGACP